MLQEGNVYGLASEDHHIDLVSNGDATLIDARDEDGDGNILTRRTALIDAGLVGAGDVVHDYLDRKLGPATALNVLVSTHYDQDHVGGLRNLLLRAGRYNNTCIYDQGLPEEGDAMDSHYSKYAYAVSGHDGTSATQKVRDLRTVALGRDRLTKAIKSADKAPDMPNVAYSVPTIPAGGARDIDELTNWLVGTEILWDGVAGGGFCECADDHLYCSEYLRSDR